MPVTRSIPRNIITAPAGVEGRRIVLPGVDTYVPAPTDVELVETLAVTPSVPLALDTEGGVIGASVDPATLRMPAAAGTEGADYVMPISAGHRVAVRVKMYDDQINTIKWRLAGDSAINVTGTIALLHPETGAVVRSSTTINFGTTAGGTFGWTPTVLTMSSLALPIPGDLIVVLQPAANLRLVASASPGGFVNESGTRAAGSVKRSGSKNVADAPLGATDDLTTGWTLRAVPFLLALRTS